MKERGRRREDPYRGLFERIATKYNKLILQNGKEFYVGGSAGYNTYTETFDLDLAMEQKARGYDDKARNLKEFIERKFEKLFNPSYDPTIDRNQVVTWINNALEACRHEFDPNFIETTIMQYATVESPRGHLTAMKKGL